MRLLDTTTGQLKEFQNNIPDYAILSHVWEKDEVTFQDIADHKKAETMQGFAKIIGACKVARCDGLKYIWIDTCCINKDSSAELSEAINSMYAWYKNARVCYAYLADVPSKGPHTDPLSFFAMSRWFTRGWTLQELIAPRKVVFYGEDWIDIGTKASLQETISAATGISTEAIAGELVLDSIPVAVRMSWAADRTTTREEDIAYSLMGLFDVNMPLLYGEGRKAFIRLQHEIIKKSTDHSIFAWFHDQGEHRGILARSPREFRYSSKVERTLSSSQGASDNQLPYSITNNGLHIELPSTLLDSGGIYAVLNCHVPGEGQIVISLVRPPVPPLSGEYVRSWITRSHFMGGTAKKLYIADDYSADSCGSKKKPMILVKLKLPANYGELHCSEVSPVLCWHDIAVNEWKHSRSVEEKVPVFSYPKVKRRFEATSKGETIQRKFVQQIVRGSSQGGVLVFESPHRSDRFAVIVGLKDLETIVWCDVLTDIQGEKARDIFESYSQHGPGRVGGKTRKTQFLDRSSAGLWGGWSVTVSSGASKVMSTSGKEYPFNVEIELTSTKCSPKIEVVRPPPGASYCILPPSPKHGFTIDTDNLEQIYPTEDGYPRWVDHLGSLYVYRANEMRVILIPFKNSWSGEGFWLLTGYNYFLEEKQSGWDVCIEKTIPKDPMEVLRAKGKLIGEGAYSAVLDEGKVVFVRQRESRGTPVANLILQLSM